MQIATLHEISKSAVVPIGNYVVVRSMASPGRFVTPVGPDFDHEKVVIQDIARPVWAFNSGDTRELFCVGPVLAGKLRQAIELEVAVDLRKECQTQIEAIREKCDLDKKALSAFMQQPLVKRVWQAIKGAA